MISNQNLKKMTIIAKKMVYLISILPDAIWCVPIIYKCKQKRRQ